MRDGGGMEVERGQLEESGDRVQIDEGRMRDGGGTDEAQTSDRRRTDRISI